MEKSRLSATELTTLLALHGLELWETHSSVPTDIRTDRVGNPITILDMGLVMERRWWWSYLTERWYDEPWMRMHACVPVKISKYHVGPINFWVSIGCPMP